MPKKNDLSLFKSGSTPAAEVPSEPQQPVKPVEQVIPRNQAGTKSLLSKRKPGRKPKPAVEKESEIVAIKLTPTELEALKEKAGLVPKSTYLKHILRNKTDVFD